jgi:hypothetical protein
MSELKIHLRKLLDNLPACQPWALGWSQMTREPGKVTCLSCRRTLTFRELARTA